MATQPTQDAVPSESPRDLKFNAGKIDEYVTYMGWTYTDRLGQKHYTIEGNNYLAQQAMAAFGYVILSGETFATGATINNPNEVLLNTVDGEYYKWTGSFASGPKVVPANSTPESTGGIGPGVWLGVGYAALSSQLSKPNGASLIGGSVFVVETFADALNSVGVKSSMMQTLCHHKPGLGGAEYVKTGTIGTPLSGNESLFYDASGIGWKIVSNPVNYYQFGAELDGISDDTLKIIAAQTHANSTGTDILQNGGVAYVTPNDTTKQIRFSTNSTFQSGFKFRTDNVNGRGFVVYPEYVVTTLTQSDIVISEFQETRITIPSLSAYKNCLACIISTETDLNRKRDEGPAYQAKRQPVVVMDGGRIDAPIWTTFNSISSIIISPINVKKVVIDGLCLETFGTQENINPIGVQRNNVEIKNLRYINGGSTATIPVQSLLAVEFARNVIIDNPVCESLSKGIVAYNYVVNTWVSSKVLIRNMTSFDGWAQVDGNYCRDITVRDSTVDRVGSHFRGYDYTFENLKTVRSRAIEVCGGGRLTVKNISIAMDPSQQISTAVALRGDYGAEWIGDVDIEGVSFFADGLYSSSTVKQVSVLSAVIDSTVGAHDFMRTVVLPKNISVRNCHLDINSAVDMYLTAVIVGSSSSIASSINYPTRIDIRNITVNNRRNINPYTVKAINYLGGLKPALGKATCYITVDGVDNEDPIQFNKSNFTESNPAVNVLTNGPNNIVVVNISNCNWLTLGSTGSTVSMHVSNSVITGISGDLNNRYYFNNCGWKATRIAGAVKFLINGGVFYKYTDINGDVLPIGYANNLDNNAMAVRGVFVEPGVTITGSAITSSNAQTGWINPAYFVTP